MPHDPAARVQSLSWRRPFEAWLNGVERGWAIPAFLAGFVAIWVAFFVIAYQSGDLHPDVLETWSIGREFAWGNPKHPPLMGWIARAWTLVFPLADWSFYLLAMLNSALALWAVDLISRRFVRGDARAVILLLLMLMPAYQFHAIRFNANTVLLATWPLAIYCFLRSFETRRASWALAAGAAAAVAMLGKYYSVFLIAGFGIAALLHPQRRAYFGSSAPWLSALAGLVVLGPHLWWLAAEGTEPFGYAVAAHGGRTHGVAAWEAAKFVLGIAAYLALPAFVWAVMIHSRLGQFVSNVTSLESGLLLLILIFGATVVLPPIISIALATDLPPLWHLQALFLAVVVAVASAKFAIQRFDSVNLSAIIAALLLVAIIAAPFHALYRNTHPFALKRNFLKLAAHEMTRRWHEATGAPFAAVSGSDGLAFAAAFYSPDHPVYRRPFRHQYTWGMPRPATLEKGWVGMCFTDDVSCIDWMNRVAAIPVTSIRTEFTLNTSLWGRPGVSATVVALMVPPVTPSSSRPIAVDGDGIEDFSASRRLR